MLPSAEHSCRSGVNQLCGTPAPSPRALRSFVGQVREDPQTDWMRSWLVGHPWPNYTLGSQIKHVRRSGSLKPEGGLSAHFYGEDDFRVVFPSKRPPQLVFVASMAISQQDRIGDLLVAGWDGICVRTVRSPRLLLGLPTWQPVGDLHPVIR